MTQTPLRQSFLLRYQAQAQGFRELLTPSSPHSGKPASGKLLGQLSQTGQSPQQVLLENASALTMLWVPPGRYWMGSPAQELDREDDEGPLHLVQLEGFFMGQTPITQAQWREVAGWQPLDGESWGRELQLNPSYFQAGYGEKGGNARLLAGELNTDQRPVEQVSWEDAIEFFNRLSQRTGRHYSLPSEAQWEYACRAGSSTPFHFGKMISPKLANYDSNYTYGDSPRGGYRGQTTPVGSLPANAWGLMDMHGNVWEWCLDDWRKNYFGEPTDGTAWFEENPVKDFKKNIRKVLRGGSWDGLPRNCRSAYRGHLRDGFTSDGDVGFRVVCLP